MLSRINWALEDALKKPEGQKRYLYLACRYTGFFQSLVFQAPQYADHTVDHVLLKAGT